jgi:hypothetical protein
MNTTAFLRDFFLNFKAETVAQGHLIELYEDDKVHFSHTCFLVKTKELCMGKCTFHPYEQK